MMKALLGNVVIAMVLAGFSTVSAAPAAGNVYNVEVQWGGASAAWNQDAQWAIGGRKDQRAVAVNIASEDGGKTLKGTMTYKGEGPIGFMGTHSGGNAYQVKVQWGGSQAKWNEDGTWIIGGRKNQPVVKLDIKSADGGDTFTGNMTYKGEGPIGFRTVGGLQKANAYTTEVQWGGTSAKWNPDATWSIGGRKDQRAVEVKIESKDDGKTFSGTMKYKGEGPIGFKGTHIASNQYKVQVQWGGANAKWNDDGVWIIGGRNDQRAVKLDISSTDGGKTLTGTMVYKGEGPIGFRTL